MPSDICTYEERLDGDTQKSKIHRLPHFDEIWLDQIGQGQRSRHLLV
jgi:hypothetical protein